MDPNLNSPASEKIVELQEMPDWVRIALDEVHAAVEALNREQRAAITEHTFDAAADLRAGADALKGTKEMIMSNWRQGKAGRADPGGE